MATLTMRGLLRASVVLVPGLLGLGLSDCAPRQPPRLRRDDPPPPVLVVAVERVALRTAAWTELHGLLAAAARTKAELPDPELEAAARAYEQALSTDERDEAFGAATRALMACDNEKCAHAALASTPFGAPFASAFPGFLKKRWADRATSARAGVEAARSALGPEIEVLAQRVAKDLAFEWPTQPPVVDVVTDAPPAGRGAPIRDLLAIRSTCFTPPKPDATEKLLGQIVGAPAQEPTPDPPQVHDARIVDCVLVYAITRSSVKSALRDALVAELGPKDGARAYLLTTIHAVAVVVTGWETRHVSALRVSALGVEEHAMKWLAEWWKDRVHGEPPAVFAKRFAAELRAGVK